MNAINVMAPYKYLNMWVFDYPSPRRRRRIHHAVFRRGLSERDRAVNEMKPP